MRDNYNPGSDDSLLVVPFLGDNTAKHASSGMQFMAFFCRSLAASTNSPWSCAWGNNNDIAVPSHDYMTQSGNQIGQCFTAGIPGDFQRLSMEIRTASLHSDLSVVQVVLPRPAPLCMLEPTMQPR